MSADTFAVASVATRTHTEKYRKIFEENKTGGNGNNEIITERTVSRLLLSPHPFRLSISVSPLGRSENSLQLSFKKDFD